MTLIVLVFLAFVPPDTLRLADCYREAESAHPRAREFALRDEAAELALDNLSAVWLPRITVGGQAVYHSNVPAIPIQIPGADMPSASHDQYRVSISLEQTIFDAGLTSDRGNLERASRDAARQDIVVELHALRRQVEDAYFAVLLADAGIESVRALRRDLNRQLASLESRVRNGVAPPSAADVLRVELIRLDQQAVELAARRRFGLDALGRLLGRSLNAETQLSLDTVPPEIPDTGVRFRPEFAALDRKRDLLDIRSTLLNGERRPRVSGFAELAYGQPPGLDLFADRFDAFYSVGLRVTWRPWDWGVVTRSRRALELERNTLGLQEEVFERTLQTAADGQIREIERIRAQIALDDSIAVIRRRISEQASSQLENGVITATDYLAERNAEEQALLARARNRVELSRAYARLAFILGKK